MTHRTQPELGSTQSGEFTQSGGAGQRPSQSEQAQQGQSMQPPQGQSMQSQLSQGQPSGQWTNQMGQQGQPLQGQSQQPMQGQSQPQSVGQGLTLEQTLPPEMQTALQDFVQAATATEWCADQCTDEGPQMAHCIRLCRDVADLALLNVRLLSRDSVFGPDVAQTFAHAAEECAQECARHSHEHCQQCAAVLGRATNSTWQMLESFGGQPQARSQPPQGQQF